MSLPAPRTDEGRAGLDALLAEPAAALVALDFDGTLAPIVADPSTSRLVDGGAAVLVALAGRVGRLAVVTGRPAASAVELGGFAAVPGLVVLGQYGAERWEAGALQTPEPPAGVATVREALPSVLADADPGVWVEDKRLSLVVHTRRAADPAGELARLAPALVGLAEANRLAGHRGRFVLEIRPPGYDKGGALRQLAAELGGTGAVLFAGDDRGDLPGFAAVEALRRQGRPGLTVASASGEVTEVADRADLVVDGPAGLVAFLAAVTAALDGATPPR